MLFASSARSIVMTNTPAVVALIPAAGSSARMSAQLPKVLLPLGAETVIERTVKAVLGCPAVTYLVILVPPSQQTKFAQLDFPEERCCVIGGGATRSQTVRLGLRHIEEQAIHADYILIHDGARCLVTTELIERSIKAAFQHQAVTAALPLVDSLKRMDAHGRVLENVSRDALYVIQTPQVFRRDLIMQAHLGVANEASDDAALVQPICPVFRVEGERTNFKITTPEDLELARRLERFPK